MINDNSVLDFMDQKNKEIKHLNKLHEMAETEFKMPLISVDTKIQKRIDKWVIENDFSLTRNCETCRYEDEYPAYHCGKRCGDAKKAWIPSHGICDIWIPYIAEYHPSVLGIDSNKGDE